MPAMALFFAARQIIVIPAPMISFYRAIPIVTVLALTLPVNVSAGPEPLLVAIVDDAFRLTHRDIEPYIWTNPREIP